MFCMKLYSSKLLNRPYWDYTQVRDLLTLMYNKLISNVMHVLISIYLCQICVIEYWSCCKKVLNLFKPVSMSHKIAITWNKSYYLEFKNNLVFTFFCQRLASFNLILVHFNH